MTDNHEPIETTSDLRQIFSSNFTISKRQLGIALCALGVLAFIGLIALDFVGGGREGGIGPAQRSAIILSIVLAIFGATLIPLGDKPA